MNLGVPHDIARGDTCLGRNWWKRNKHSDGTGPDRT
jgi:hypothetical protein